MIDAWIEFSEAVDAKIMEFFQRKPSESSVKTAVVLMRDAIKNSPDESVKKCWEYAAKRLTEKAESLGVSV